MPSRKANVTLMNFACITRTPPEFIMIFAFASVEAIAKSNTTPVSRVFAMNHIVIAIFRAQFYPSILQPGRIRRISLALAGPGSFEQWDACFRVFRSAAVMLNMLSPSKCEAYMNLIRKYNTKYGHKCWHIIYQADVRARQEHWERCRREAAEEHRKANAAGQTHAFDVSKPWEYALMLLINDFRFWKDELEDPCILVMTKMNAANTLPDDEELFNNILAEIRAGVYAGILLGPPCETFSNARNEHDGGPRPLRGPWGKDLYGYSHLLPDEKEQVRIGTMLALRALVVFELAIDLDIPAVHEHPLEEQDGVSIYHFEAWQRLLSKSGVNRYDIVQCELGAPSVKPTTLVTWKVVLSSLPQCCTCPKMWLWDEFTQQWLWRAHLPLRGWREDGVFRTKAASAYPRRMNEVLALGILQEALRAKLQRKRKLLTPETRNSIKPVQDKPRMQFSWSLAGMGPCSSRDKDQEDRCSVGGLRNPMKDLGKLHVMKERGQYLRSILRDMWEAFPHLKTDLIAAVEANSVPDLNLDEVCKWWATRLGIVDCGPVCNSSCKTDLRYGIIKAIAQHCLDPDRSIVEWLVEGTPAGIEVPLQETPLLPLSKVDDEDETAVELAMDYDGFKNYISVEGDLAADSVIQEFISTKYVRAFDCYEDVKEYLHGHEPALSRLAMITKHFHDETGTLVRTKRRLILDCLRSGVNAHAKQPNRIVLPRLCDAVNSILEAMRAAKSETALFVIDIADAFWQLPLAMQERRFFCFKYKAKYVVFERLAQGSRNAPLAWCRFIGMISRITAAIMADDPFQLQTFVDDPLVISSGTTDTIKECVASFVALWLIMGLKFAFKKAQFGTTIVWIGARLTCTKHGAEVSLKEETIQDVIRQTEEFMATNVIAIKKLRSYAGKCSHAASLVPPWKPFLKPLWAAIAQQSQGTNAPVNTVWTKQIISSLSWVLCFLKRQAGTLSRNYPLDSYLNQGRQITIVFDASPWGLGAFALLNGQAVAWIAAPLDEYDEAA